MIEYAVQDINEIEYVLNDTTIDQPARGSLTFSSEMFTYESKDVENSALSGAVKLGKTRLQSRLITLELERSHASDSNWKVAENEFIKNMASAYYLIDKTNSRRVRVDIQSINIGYAGGGHKQNSVTSVTLKLLDPFWENTTQDSQDETLTVTTNEISINNQGVVIVYPILTFIAASAVASIEAFVDETQEGILIEDSIFGTTGFSIMVCDCGLGTLKIGDLDRSISIAGGTGYFSLPIGLSLLKATPDVGLELNIQFRQRQYV